MAAADAAFAYLRGDVEVDSLAGLREVAGRPLVTVRCRRDGTLSAGVWRTGCGPLLVTGHRPTTHLDRSVRGTLGAGAFVIGRSPNRIERLFDTAEVRRWPGSP